MNLRYILLSERLQAQKAKYCILPFTQHFGKSTTVVTDIRAVVSRDMGGGKKSNTKEPAGIWADDRKFCRYLSKPIKL